MGREMLRFWWTDGKGRDGRERDGRGEALCCPNAGRWIGANARRRFCKSSFRPKTKGLGNKEDRAKGLQPFSLENRT